MDLSKKYAMKVNEKKSFSAAAKVLFVSQPALSLAVGRLEDELGFKIFERSTSPLSLTPEGRVYMEYLYGEQQREGEMQARIRELSDLSYGSLSVGASCYTSYHILPGIIAAFSKLHPKIKIKLDMGNEAEESVLYDKVERGELDVILKYDYDKSRHKATTILCEKLGIAMPLSMVTDRLVPFAITCDELLGGAYLGKKEFLDVSIFSGGPVLRMGEHSQAMALLRSALGELRISPYYISGARHTAMHYNLMKEGLGAAYISDVHVLTSNLFEADLRFFMPASQVSRTLYAIENKNSPTNPIAEEFIKLAVDYCKKPLSFRTTEA